MRELWKLSKPKPPPNLRPLCYRFSTERLGENFKVEFLEWKHHIDGLERMDGFCWMEKQEAKESLEYLQGVLGDDFISKASGRIPSIGHHPLLMLLANFAPCSRRHIARFAAYLRILEGSQNLDKVVARLQDAAQFGHDALLIKLAAKLVREGLRARFEPTMPVLNNQKQPDLRLDDPLTRETVFLEVAAQAPAKRWREATDLNSAVFNAVFGISLDLCVSGHWHKTPSKQALGDLLERVKASARRGLNERSIDFVQEEGTLEMAVCHRDQRATLLDPWSKERGLSCGFLGPPISRNDTFRLKLKIQREQDQLPRDSANVIVILAPDAFLGLGGVRRVIREVEEEVFKYDHVHLVIVHGEYIDDREVPFIGQTGGHQYTRNIVDGTVENDLLLLNRDSRMKLSPNLIARFYRVFQGTASGAAPS